MTLTRRDLSAAVLTVLVVLTYAATHEGWGVPLVGDSRRWAAGAILLLGMGACGMGSKVSRTTMMLFGTVGTLALVFAVLAFWTASLTPLSLLVVCIVLLFAMSTVRHAGHAPGRPVAAA
jgi:hypothetical protein